MAHALELDIDEVEKLTARGLAVRSQKPPAPDWLFDAYHLVWVHPLYAGDPGAVANAEMIARDEPQQGPLPEPEVTEVSEDPVMRALFEMINSIGAEIGSLRQHLNQLGFAITQVRNELAILRGTPPVPADPFRGAVGMATFGQTSAAEVRCLFCDAPKGQQHNSWCRTQAAGSLTNPTTEKTE